MLYLALGIALFAWAGAALVLQWRTLQTALLVYAALAFLATPTSAPRALAVLWAAAVASCWVTVLALAVNVVPWAQLAVCAFAFPWGVVVGLDDGRWWPDFKQLAGFLDNLTRGAFLLAGVLALAGAKYRVKAADLSAYLTGQYSFFVFLFGAVLLLAAVGYVLGVPCGAAVRKYADWRADV